MLRIYYLYIIVILLLTACGGNKTEVGVDYNTNNHPKVNAKVEIGGRVANSKVEIFEIENNGKPTLKWTEKTSSDKLLEKTGIFNAHINELNPNRVYLYKASGGEDWDVDSDGVKDAKATKNSGVLRAIGTGKDFQKAGSYFNITVVSEMLYEKTAKYYKYYDFQKLNEALRNDSSRFVKDIDNDAKIDINDILTFDPLVDKERLVSLYNAKFSEIVKNVHAGKIILLSIDNVLYKYDTNGEVMDVKLSKDKTRAYLADGSNGLVILDVSNRLNPVEMSHIDTDGHASKIVLSFDETIAYLADNQNGLLIVNVEDVLNPVIVGKIDTRNIWDVCLSKNEEIAYIANFNELMVVDITDAAHPSTLSHLKIEGEVIGTTMSKDQKLLYVASGSKGLTIVNISIPTEPKIVSSVDITGGPAYSVVLSKDESKAYIASGMYSGLAIIDISDFEHPFVLGEIPTDGVAFSILLSKDETKAYISDTENGLLMINITNPKKPSLVGHINSFALSIDIIDQEKAYIASSKNGLILLDLTLPIRALKIADVFVDGATTALEFSNKKTKVYMANGYSGLAIVDISSVLTPLMYSFVDTPGFATDVVMSVDFTKVYVADYQGIVVIDITNSLKPVIIGRVDLKQVGKIVLSSDGTKLYTANRNQGFSIVDISNPVEPVVLQTFDTQGLVRDIVLSKDESKVYLADELNGLLIIDVSTLENPIIIDHIDTKGKAKGLALSKDENRVYLADGLNGLQIIDISILGNSIITDRINTNGFSAQDLVLSKDEKKVYVAEGLGGLMIVDIGSTNTPYVIKNIDTDSIAYALKLSEDERRVYIAGGKTGLVVIGLDIFDN